MTKMQIKAKTTPPSYCPYCRQGAKFELHEYSDKRWEQWCCKECGKPVISFVETTDNNDNIPQSGWFENI